jgi:hypothetical protein
MKDEFMQAIDDYINGNLTDAKRRARKAGRKRITEALREEYGYGANATLAILSYLFDGGSFQAACDAEHAQKGQP